MSEKIRPLGLLWMFFVVAKMGVAATTAGDVGSIELTNLYVESMTVQPEAQKAEVVLSQYGGPYTPGQPRLPRATRNRYPVQLDLKNAGDQAIYALTLNGSREWGPGLDMTVENGAVTVIKFGSSYGPGK